MQQVLAQIEEARNYILGHTQVTPKVGIILGTGLGPLAKRIVVDAEIPYASIPHFSKTTLEDHAGQWISGHLGGQAVAVMQGRLHFYEGHSMQDIAFPIRVMKSLGVKTLIITNIAGGVNPQFKMGDIMAISDHINLLGTNPLIGSNSETIGPRFPDMSEPYNKRLLLKMMELASAQGLSLRKGVYACMSGPCLETAAEYRMLRILGADAVGMSTVPEVIAAVHASIQIVALSLITDVCDPDDLQPINIPEIMRVATEMEPKIANLVEELLKTMP